MNEARQRKLYLVMGVSGSGKSTLGRSLADALGTPFFDADDFHPPTNIIKMAAGTPLNDADRAPWLATLNQHIRKTLHTSPAVVLACSALKQVYRVALAGDVPKVHLLFLHGPRDLLAERLWTRQNHFFGANLLDSQLESLETPQDAVWIDAASTPREQLAEAIAATQAKAAWQPYPGGAVTPD